jgi:RNA polymerase sigma-70 factor (ECF subfamily)
LRRPRLSTLSIDADEFELPTRPTQSDALELRDLESALGHLADEQREILLLVALEETSYADIATTLGIPIGTVMSRLSRGRERLRLIMDGQTANTRLRVVR